MTERWAARPLVGRRDDIAALAAALGTVQQGRMASVFLTGDAGVGKTRLVQELVGMAERAGTSSVLLGGATDIAESPPFWPVVSALRSLLRSAHGGEAQRVLAPWSEQLDELLALRSAAPAPTGPETRVQTLELLHRVVARLAAHSTVVLVVEDLHWADRSTLDLVAYLVANLADESLLLAGTVRTEPGRESAPASAPARTMVRELGRHRQVRSIEVAPLARAAVAELVEATAPGRSDLVELVWKRSAGNPFIAEETLRAALDGDPTGLPTTLRELVLSRVDPLSTSALRAVQAIALSDGPLPHRLLAAVLDVDGPDDVELNASLREGVDAGVVVADGESYRLRHGLMTDVVVGELLPGERGLMHRRYATALERPWARELPGVDARIAHHWHAAGDPDRAAAATVVAARAAEHVHGYSEAHRHWLLAARLAGLLPAPPAPRGECLERAAEAAHLAGDADQAVALLGERLRLHDSGETETGEGDLVAARLHARTGQYLVAAGRGAEAAGAFGRATALLPAGGAARERAEVLGRHAHALWTAGDYAAAQAMAVRALAPAQLTGLAVDETRALTTLGFSLAYRQDQVAGEAALRQSLAVAERAGDPREIARAYRSLAELLSGPLNELERGIAIAREGFDRVAALGMERSAGVGLLAQAANGLFRLGRWYEADAVVARAWDLDPSGAQALELRLARARMDIGRGRFAAAEDDLEAVDALSASTVGPRYRIPMLTLRAGLAMWQGRPDVALNHVAAGLDVVERGSDDIWLVAPLVWHGARARAEVVRLGIRRAEDKGGDGIGGRLRRHAAALADSAAASVPAVRNVVQGYLEMCAAEDGRAMRRSDPSAWERVAEIWRSQQQPYPSAYAQLRRAEALLAHRARSSAATDALRRAAATARALGAEPFLAEIADLAERARIPIDVPDDDRDVDGEPDEPDRSDELAELTPREREVLAEIANGLTNKQIAERLFISEKTVGVHVSRIYAKIGVRTRVQASAVYLRAAGGRPT